MNAKPTQIETIKADLLAGHKVNSVLAFDKHHITRLAAIIERLRRRGWPVTTTQQKRNRIAEYSLPEAWRPDIK
jgi:hypothetical protein